MYKKIGLLVNLIIILTSVFWTQDALPDGMLIPTRPNAPAFAVKYHHVSVSIDQQVAKTKIDQVFRNEADRELEGTYLFPLPNGAVVSDFAMYVGDEEIKGRILKKAEARRIYEDIVRKRKDPALLEYIGRNTFYARVYPIPARGEKRVLIEYSEVLNMDSGVCRYVYTLDTERFSSKPLEEVVITVDIRSKAPMKTVYSPTHDVAVSRRDDHHVQVSYEAANIKPDEDFIVYYTVSEKDIGLNLLPYRESGDNGFYLLMASPRVELGEEELGSKHVSFVLDTSGSMKTSNKIQQAKDALKFCVRSLNKQDKFNIIAFNSTIEPYKSELVDAEERNIRDALSFVSKFEAKGSTNINEALLNALSAFHDRSDPNIVVFLTDGLPTVGETNIDKILENVKQANKANVRLFVFGVGYDVNTHFLDKLAQNSRAASEYVRPNEDIEAKVSSFFSKVTSPVLSEIALDYGNIMTYDQFPRELPDLFKGSQLIVLGRYKESGKAELKLSGTVKGAKQTFTYPVEFPKRDTRHDFIPRLWAARKIGFLLDEIRLHGQDDELVDEVVTLSKKYGIMTEFTSFLIDADEEMARPEVARRMAGDRFGEANEAQHGAWAVSQSQNVSQFRNQEQIVKNVLYDENGQQIQFDSVRYIAGRTFFYRNGTWVDATYVKGQEIVQVQNFSKAYFQISQNSVDVNQYLALGPNVIVNLGGQAIQISDEGQSVLTQSELDAVFGN
ncbi:VIT domain-containing protein [Candidatus Poribacteria bacterium]